MGNQVYRNVVFLLRLLPQFGPTHGNGKRDDRKRHLGLLNQGKSDSMWSMKDRIPNPVFTTTSCLRDG